MDKVSYPATARGGVMGNPTVSIHTSYGNNNDDPFSEVELGFIALCRFLGEAHREKALAMADEISAVIQKYRDMEVK